MIDLRIAAERMQRQRLTKPAPADPVDVVEWFGAVQAQEYGPAKWALALRMRGCVTDAQIERACNDGRILRTHAMRPTWHFVSARDIHWLLELTAPRVKQGMAFAQKYSGVTAADHRRAAGVIARALDEHECLTRTELAGCLARAGVPAKGIALAVIVIHAEQEGIICSGPRRGKHYTYALLDRRASRPKQYPRDEALGELTTRYLRSHAPATVRDFSWWSGLTIADAKRGLEIVGARRHVAGTLTYWTIGPRRAVTTPPRDLMHVLPIYDEYLVAYRDQVAVPRGKPSWGLLAPSIVWRGEVIGAWKSARGNGEPKVTITLGRKLTAAERQHLDRALARYTQFVQS